MEAWSKPLKGGSSSLATPRLATDLCLSMGLGRQTRHPLRATLLGAKPPCPHTLIVIAILRSGTRVHAKPDSKPGARLGARLGTRANAKPDGRPGATLCKNANNNAGKTAGKSANDASKNASG